jgi:hypothetical protein
MELPVPNCSLQHREPKSEIDDTGHFLLGLYNIYHSAVRNPADAANQSYLGAVSSDARRGSPARAGPAPPRGASRRRTVLQLVDRRCLWWTSS